MTNRLAAESSPYLLQHANNPVDWYPWGEEAMERARNENKPIFLSIGYSACHWCHVMEHESFADATIADALNRHFISIKVDREERPDLDQIYMQAVQLITGRGGWPMSVFLAPNLKPFFGGTYWPPRAARGMPGFDQVLAGVKEAWDNRQKTALEQADILTNKINEAMAPAADDDPITAETLWQAAVQLERSYDPVDGGFGQPPKFPKSMDLQLLLRVWQRTGKTPALEMVTTTLDRMAAGGLYDHLGGGFARYSTDKQWLVPHFEKMLYDNALLSLAYLEAWQVTRNDQYEAVVRETMEYILRDMTDTEGGFYSTEDADSEGVEGKFYVWSLAEVQQVLGTPLAERFSLVFDVTKEGNFEGQNILHRPQRLAEVCAAQGWDESELQRQLAEGKAKLFEAREKRVRPGKDDKVLVSWNGLMIDAMSRSGAALADASLTHAAVRAAGFVWGNMRDDAGQLLHVWRQGEARQRGFLDDYACYANALVTLFECTADGVWLERATDVADRMIEQFADTNAAGFFFTGNDHEQLITRNKDYYDGSVPSGNSMAAMLLMRLGKLTGSSVYLDTAIGTIESAKGMLQKYPGSVAQMMLAANMQVGPTQELVVTGSKADCAEMIGEIHRNFLPNRVVASHNGGAPPTALAGLLAEKEAGGAIKLFVCENFACQAPVEGRSEISSQLREMAQAIGR